MRVLYNQQPLPLPGCAPEAAVAPGSGLSFEFFKDHVLRPFVLSHTDHAQVLAMLASALFCTAVRWAGMRAGGWSGVSCPAQRVLYKGSNPQLTFAVSALHLRAGVHRAADARGRHA